MENLSEKKYNKDKVNPRPWRVDTLIEETITGDKYETHIILDAEGKTVDGFSCFPFTKLEDTGFHVIHCVNKLETLRADVVKLRNKAKCACQMLIDTWASDDAAKAMVQSKLDAYQHTLDLIDREETTSDSDTTAGQ